MKEMVDPIIKYITQIHLTERVWIVITIILGVSMFSVIPCEVLQGITIQKAFFSIWFFWGILTIIFHLCSAVILAITKWINIEKMPNRVPIIEACPICKSNLDIRHFCPKCGKEVKLSTTE